MTRVKLESNQPEHISTILARVFGELIYEDPAGGRPCALNVEPIPGELRQRIEVAILSVWEKERESGFPGR
jgi:hypothetical protein